MFANFSAFISRRSARTRRTCRIRTPTIIRNRINAIGRSMKSSGSFTRAIPARSFTSIIPPNTIPSIMGTTGRLRRFKAKPVTPKSAAMMQSVIEFLSEYTPTKLRVRMIAPKKRLGIFTTFMMLFVAKIRKTKTSTFRIKSAM